MSIQLPQKKATKAVPKDSTKTSIWSFMNRDIQFFEPKFGIKKKLVLYGQLETLLGSGLDIQASLELIEQSFKKKQDQALIRGLKESIVKGKSLSESMAELGKFSIYEQYSVQIGEETGRLHLILRDLSSFFEKTLSYQRQLTGALAYPVFVLSFSVLAVLFLLRYLVPMFSGIYGRFKQELPSLTQMVVNLSGWVGVLMPYLLISVLLLIVGAYSQREKLWYRKMMGWVLSHIPLFGGIIQKVYLSRFCQAMALLLAAGVPLLNALKLVQQMINFYPVSSSLKKTEQAVFQGAQLHEVLSQFDFYPPQALALIKVGEESGKLDMMFERLARQYTEEVDQQTAVIGSLIEPVLIVFLGGIVAVILVAMYLPLFKMSTSMGF
ncbi:type II secretion system F family protein [Aureispira sp. CCB-E]|uniref:type II secretion system F family protein n=1 Tax=Aureispira sp. CCB-E TaxID=3051121 RepID=UPI0028684524|nr:type II secretion system F family protein [Aureispira sp. CCB-E]WMX12603.1 type II secretion system F family protein [Aureispira sp. CCB-E]